MGEFTFVLLVNPGNDLFFLSQLYPTVYGVMRIIGHDHNCLYRFSLTTKEKTRFLITSIFHGLRNSCRFISHDRNSVYTKSNRRETHATIFFVCEGVGVGVCVHDRLFRMLNI